MIIASAGEYPSLVERLPSAGPLIQGLLLMLIVSFVWGMFTLLRHRPSPRALILIVWLPTLFGCILAGVQSLIAEQIVTGSGMVYWSRPDRYIGDIRLFLGLGIGSSALLFCTHRLAMAQGKGKLESGEPGGR